MKREERKAYTALAELVDYLLCSFCRYGSFSGSSCSGGEYECDHPLSGCGRFPNEDGLGPGDDCWGFRKDKRFDLATAADIIGTMLAEGFESTTWVFLDNGKIEVRGVKK